MGKKVAVSFEEDHVKVVKADFKGGRARIEKTETIEYHEFDNYLRKEKTTDFIVTYDFKEAFHGTLKLPMVKPRYQKNLVAAELRKITKLDKLSFIYMPLGERVDNGRKSMEVFYFAANDEVIQDVVGRFYDYGKTVKAVYPTVFSAAALIRSRDNDELSMGIFSTGKEKLVFFVKKGEIHFIRNYESLDDDLSDFDIQNINMTISYCFQNFRQTPSALVLLGNLAGSEGFRAFPTIPVTALLMPQEVDCGKADFNQYFLPIASLFAPRSANVLSKSFVNVNMLKAAMSMAAALFMITVVIAGVLIFNEIGAIYRTYGKMEELRPDSNEVESVYSSYIENQGKFENVMPLIGFLNGRRGDISGLLAGIGAVSIRDMKFRSAEASLAENGSYAVTITGEGSSDDYSGLQASFQRLVSELGRSPGIRIRSTTMNLAGKSFRIDMEYGEAG